MPLEQTIDERVVHRLWLAGVLPRDRHGAALRLARDDGFWRRWGERAALALAAGHLLAAVIFFFAFNWQDLGPLAKLALLQGGVVMAALGSRLSLLPEILRETLLLAATVLVGVLLATFGQIYQTGADAWQLFAGWAALTLPWVLSGRSAGHWLVWLAVCQLGIWLYIDGLAYFHTKDGQAVGLLLVAGPALPFLVGRDLLWKHFDWLQPGWVRLVPLVQVLGAMFIGAEMAVFNDAPSWAAVVFVAGLAAAAAVYAGLWRDFAAVALMVLLGCGFVATLLVRATDIDADFFGLFIPALEISAVFGCGSWLLRRLHRAWATGGDHA